MLTLSEMQAAVEVPLPAMPERVSAERRWVQQPAAESSVEARGLPEHQASGTAGDSMDTAPDALALESLVPLPPFVDIEGQSRAELGAAFQQLRLQWLNEDYDAVSRNGLELCSMLLDLIDIHVTQGACPPRPDVEYVGTGADRRIVFQRSAGGQLTVFAHTSLTPASWIEVALRTSEALIRREKFTAALVRTTNPALSFPLF
jgi:hypothetical protein